jgi:hypothetical protein
VKGAAGTLPVLALKGLLEMIGYETLTAILAIRQGVAYAKAGRSRMVDSASMSAATQND